MKDGNSIPPNEGKPVRVDLSNSIVKQLSKPIHSMTVETKSSNNDSTLIDSSTSNLSKQNEVNIFFYAFKIILNEN